jgi:superfamily I DNA/RNA helicase
MTKKLSDTQLLNLVGTHGPVKAKQLATIFSKEFGFHVDRSDINSMLYRLKTEGKAKINKQYEWTREGSGARAEQEPALENDLFDPAPLDATITFTPEQEAIINLDPQDHLLIRGQAGSGKTTVLAARAGRILSSTGKGSLLFLTYNSALTAYVKKAFKKAGLKNDLDVMTYHDWAKRTSKALGFEFQGWVNGKVRNEQVKKLIAESKKELGEHRLFDIDTNAMLPNWWGEEIAWLFGQHVTRLDEYLKVERIGRGKNIRLSQEDRRFVWHVFEAYQQWLEETGSEDYDNPAGLVLRALMTQGADLPGELRYDHVMVDEVQDFDKSWLMAVAKVPRASLSMAGDLAQKIYRRSFTWNSVGIQVQGGRSRKLSASHRTTLQIMDVAEYLLANNDVSNMADYTPPVRPTKNGNKVRIINAADPRSAYTAGYEWVARNFKRLRTTTVAVAMPFNKQLIPAQKALEKLGVTVKKAKGATLGSFDGGVVVTTYHQLKGLEFDHVVVMGLHDAQYPGRLLEKVPEEDQADEENLLRRVLYVAMTRAKESVTLVGSDPFCRFLKDVPDGLTEKV